MNTVKNVLTTILDAFLAAIILMVVLVVGNTFIVVCMVALMLWFTPHAVAAIWKAFIKS